LFDASQPEASLHQRFCSTVTYDNFVVRRNRTNGESDKSQPGELEQLLRSCQMNNGVGASLLVSNIFSNFLKTFKTGRLRKKTIV